jgi:hypothetical protein
MTRSEYIAHLEVMRTDVMAILGNHYKVLKAKGRLTKATTLEEDRNKKTIKMIEDVDTRLYEDGAISQRLRDEKILAGEPEQEEMDLGGEG